MKQISFYLKKFENLGLRESNIKKALIESVKEILEIDLKKEEISLINNQIRIKKNGIEKTEIFIHRKNIEKIFNEKLEKISGDKKSPSLII